MTLNSQKSFLVNFSQFLAETHTLKVNCDEMAGDRLRQSGNNFFGIKVRF